jgi:hypothetical protein
MRVKRVYGVVGGRLVAVVRRLSGSAAQRLSGSTVSGRLGAVRVVRCAAGSAESRINAVRAHKHVQGVFLRVKRVYGVVGGCLVAVVLRFGGAAAHRLGGSTVSGRLGAVRVVRAAPRVPPSHA